MNVEGLVWSKIKSALIADGIELDSVISSGTQGVVCKCIAIAGNAYYTYAIKIMNNYVKCYEIHSLEGIKHLPHSDYVVRFHRLGKADNYLFYTMDYIEGVSLSQYISKATLKEEEAISIMLDILKGVKHLHDNEYIHRDLKPSNIMITNNKQGIICDLGSVKHLNSTVNTQSTTIMVSEYYTAPEPIKTMKSDVFSCGLILKKMLTGCTDEDARLINCTTNNNKLNNLILRATAYQDADRSDVNMFLKELAEVYYSYFIDNATIAHIIELYTEDAELHSIPSKIKSFSGIPIKDIEIYLFLMGYSIKVQSDKNPLYSLIIAFKERTGEFNRKKSFCKVILSPTEEMDEHTYKSSETLLDKIRGILISKEIKEIETSIILNYDPPHFYTATDLKIRICNFRYLMLEDFGLKNRAEAIINAFNKEESNHNSLNRPRQNMARLNKRYVDPDLAPLSDLTKSPDNSKTKPAMEFFNSIISNNIPQRVMIMGEAGSGKSSILEKFEKECANNYKNSHWQHPLAIRIILNEIKINDGDVEEHIFKTLFRDTAILLNADIISIKKKDIVALLVRYQSLILLMDGIDEYYIYHQGYFTASSTVSPKEDHKFAVSFDKYDVPLDLFLDENGRNLLYKPFDELIHLTDNESENEFKMINSPSSRKTRGQ